MQFEDPQMPDNSDSYMVQFLSDSACGNLHVHKLITVNK